MLFQGHLPATSKLNLDINVYVHIHNHVAYHTLLLYTIAGWGGAWGNDVVSWFSTMENSVREPQAGERFFPQWFPLIMQVKPDPTDDGRSCFHEKN